jgi:hypothetical protein
MDDLMAAILGLCSELGSAELIHNIHIETLMHKDPARFAADDGSYLPPRDRFWRIFTTSLRRDMSRRYWKCGSESEIVAVYTRDEGKADHSTGFGGQRRYGGSAKNPMFWKNCEWLQISCQRLGEENTRWSQRITDLEIR